MCNFGGKRSILLCWGMVNGKIRNFGVNVVWVCCEDLGVDICKAFRIGFGIVSVFVKYSMK